MIFTGLLVLMNASHPRGVSAIVLLLSHHGDLVVAAVGLVVRLVVVAEAFHH